jgi:hypothetical protein
MFLARFFWEVDDCRFLWSIFFGARASRRVSIFLALAQRQPRG